MFQIHTGFLPFQPRTTLTKQSTSRFGCRITGGMTTTQSKAGDQFIKRLTTMVLPAMAKGSLPTSPGVYPSASLLTNDQSHGWGYANFINKRSPAANPTLKTFKSPNNILNDRQFHVQRFALMKDSVSSAVSHARRATEGPNSPENTHPFRLKMDGTEWTFVHNGRWENALSDEVKNHLQENPAFSPHGTTDSEHAFLFLMQSVRSQLGTVNSHKTGKEPLKRAVAEAIRELSRQSEPSIFSDIKASRLNIHGKVRVGPALNFIVNDGNIMFAYRNGQSLFLGVQLDGQGKPVAHAVSTAPKSMPGVLWFDVLDNTLILITKDKTGKSQAEILPLESIPPVNAK